MNLKILDSDYCGVADEDVYPDDVVSNPPLRLHLIGLPRTYPHAYQQFTKSFCIGTQLAIR